MLFPTDARQWVGKLVVMEWTITFAKTGRRMATNSGGRVLSVDDTYLVLQPFGLTEPSAPGEAVTRLGLQIEEENIPLVDIDTIYPAPLEGIQVVE
jgi:hypothetical protein